MGDLRWNCMGHRGHNWPEEEHSARDDKDHLASRCSRRAAGARKADAVAWGVPLAAERQDVSWTSAPGGRETARARMAPHLLTGSPGPAQAAH